MANSGYSAVQSQEFVVILAATEVIVGFVIFLKTTEQCCSQIFTKATLTHQSILCKNIHHYQSLLLILLYYQPHPLQLKD